MGTVCEYSSGGTRLVGYLAQPRGDGPAAGVVVAHAWSGCSDFERNRADALAGMGYVALAADVYGDGRTGDTVEEKQGMMAELLEDRGELRRRIQVAVSVLQARDDVDSGRIAAIGYCFGGLTVLDLARSGADVRAVVSFHGLVTPAEGIPNTPIRAQVLVLNGAGDPMVSPEGLHGLELELDAAGAHWQVVNYGGAKHSFTNPGANSPEMGMVYDERTANRSWRAMSDFLVEVLA